MMGKGKCLEASWTMARKLLASVSYRIATRRKRFNLEKNREGLEWVAGRRLMKPKVPQMPVKLLPQVAWLANSLSRPGGLALLSRPIRSSLHAETESDSVPHDP